MVRLLVVVFDSVTCLLCLGLVVLGALLWISVVWFVWFVDCGYVNSVGIIFLCF